ncbi:hypothetical protein NQ015_10875 [Corynebacterium sp. 153RC1]|uniref:hypothetical protein n=1 Tax=unclassified Corynebacterium TaxID=2624378 RepID=UPI00211BE09B|nr:MULTISPECIES: hypothetical protein [unclassified Corynebacterium]MCQ9353517.1 hypothetical protein [Corynebacterium sp. 209RC1]MCQ9355738.1 hypothetical protein [Corynebacterium sp. 1222RC1]MCQ9357908.1 hypothetical protein [Corynebacterium sp. 122RC1]MCQ9360104.1 hypothetical protein [Corynebacterium sp. 142RC1]MCQ9362247.1 hypothetical protein [Corynebacterium sp. 153RC1]
MTGADAADLSDGMDTDEAVSAQLDAKLAAQDRAASSATNVTFVAFTATPKPKTMRIFGTYDPETDARSAFDHYTMAQAIQEGFILDVLTNYTTYSNYIPVSRSR